MNVGAIMVLDVGSGFELPAAQAVFAERARAITRLRQRLVDTPYGCGRPIWVDVPSFDVGWQLAWVRCPSPGDRAALLEVAADAITRPLPRSRPLWRAVFVSGLASGQMALIVVFHHVLADGIGGLAVLASLVDGADPAHELPPGPPPRLPPTRGQLLADAMAARLRGIRGTRGAVVRLGAAVAELGTGRGRPSAAPRCSLNAPTGRRRRFATVEVELAPVRDAAHRHGATVNDLLLAAITGALRELLRHRGERVPALVVSVPVSARRATTSGDLGNSVGVMPIRVPMTGPAGSRLAQISSITRQQKAMARGASAALVGPVFRLLAAAGMFRPMVNRQRLVNAFLTNLPGPARGLRFHGAPISAVVPITVTAGNVSVAFAVLSYAGALTTTVIVDPDLVPELTVLTAALESEFRILIGRR
jgi:WS/DGAT/MGAT family acyltransferase